MTVFNNLLSSSLPITWNVVIFAYWERFEIPLMAQTLISTEQVLEFAMDRIGYDPPELERWTIELAYAHDRDTWTINRCLEELISEDPREVERALRTWRWILLNQEIAISERWAKRLPNSTAPDYEAWTGEYIDGVYENLYDIWTKIRVSGDATPLYEDMLSPDENDNMSAIMRIFEEHHRWLDQEKVALRSL